MSWYIGRLRDVYPSHSICHNGVSTGAIRYGVPSPLTMKYPKVAGYELVQHIGGGGFSRVFQAVHLENHRVAACKLIYITEETSEKERKNVDKEMKIHAALKHRNILEFISAVIVELKYKHHYVPGIYMLLELAAGGDLFDKIAPDIGTGEDVAQLYFKQLVDGMEFIHAQGVCHRDLKPENLLLDAAGTLKISDFGLSAVFKQKETGKTRLLSERCGSLPYIAPELNYGEPYQAEPIDIWGMGVILFALLAGNTPWDQPTDHSLEFCRYLSGEIFNDEPWTKFSTNVLSLICGMLALEPEKRMTISEIHGHPWCTRPSQLATRGPRALAEQLTQSLRDNGDLMYANPALSGVSSKEVDGDDGIMSSAQSQFTQSLLLFSQTQNGRRYNPHLTRFYTSIGPGILIDLVKESLDVLEVKYKDSSVSPGSGSRVVHRLRVGGYDKRKIMYKGWIELETFNRMQHASGAFCVMQRDVGNPISWRQLWKSLILSPAVSPHVLRK